MDSFDAGAMLPTWLCPTRLSAIELRGLHRLILKDSISQLERITQRGSRTVRVKISPPKNSYLKQTSKLNLPSIEIANGLTEL